MNILKRIGHFLIYRQRQFHNLNQINVYKKNLLHNYKYLTRLNSKVKIAPVIKSNGYGCGIVNVAKILEGQNPPFFCVDSLFEAYELTQAGIKTPILITGYTDPANLQHQRLPFAYAVYTSDLLEAISRYQPHAEVHLFIDTGMRREGVTVDELPNFLQLFKFYPNLQITGVMSHLASSESKNDPLFLKQIKQFEKALVIIKSHKIKPRWVHVAATGSLINPQTQPIIAKYSNLARAGLALYGFSSSVADPNLQPVLTLKSKISQIKLIRRGEKVGYEGTYTAKKDILIGVLPIGYYDGVDRGLSNQGAVQVNGAICPIIGRVSMNLTVIDLSSVENPKIGQQVTIYSASPNDQNSIENVAKVCKKIPYEILVNLASSTKRVVT